MRTEYKTIIKEGFKFVSLGLLIFLVFGISLISLLDTDKILNPIYVTLAVVIITIFIIIADNKWIHSYEKMVESLDVIFNLKKKTKL